EASRLVPRARRALCPSTGKLGETTPAAVARAVTPDAGACARRARNGVFSSIPGAMAGAAEAPADSAKAATAVRAKPTKRLCLRIVSPFGRRSNQGSVGMSGMPWTMHHLPPDEAARNTPPPGVDTEALH